MHFVIEASALKILFEPPPYFKVPVSADCDVAEIEKPVNIGT
jgi:hypothetical protein